GRRAADLPDNGDFQQQTMIKVFDQYDKYCNRSGLVDFAELLLRALELFKNNEMIRTQYQLRYQHILVDEFQDTNMMQWAIFKKIFFEKSNETGNRLMIIGDPKQAIYGFRGADLNAYLRAKDEMLAVGASFYRLSVNYRSMPDLISSFNAFFQPWFGEEADVSAPEDRMGRGPQLGFDNTESVAFNIIDAGSEKRLANRLKRFMAERMAGWVERLIGKMEYHLGKEKRVLGPSDICFLIRKRSEAPFIEEALKELGISSSFYKKPGIYKSAEALQFRIILSALTEQEGKGMLKAFLSIFFGMTPEDLPELERRVPPALESRWLRLLELSRLREWPRFFKGLLDDSGVCFLLADDNRSLTNLKQIAKELTKEAVKGDLDAAALLGRLMEKIDSGGSEDEDLHERDTDKPAVKIMTIHASKGLEFPVVFLFAEMTGKNWSESYLKYYDVDIKRTVYDFSTTLNLDENRKNELAGEKCNEVLRLFYVAFTRSVFKLFVPVYTPASKTGEYTKYVLGRVLESMVGIEEIKPIRNETLPNVLSREAEPKSSEIPFSPSKPPFVAFRTRRIRSFSTLAGKKLLDVADFTLGDPGEAKPLDEFQLPSEKVAAEFVKVYPPPGRKTGDVLHETLERMDFALRAEFANFDDFAVRNELKKLIIECMTANGFKQDEIKDEKGAVVGTLSREFAKLIWNALGKGIPCLDGLRLCDLPREDACKEMGFLLSTGADSLSGIIDLLFRVRDGDGFFTYYILDWKGNHSPEGYSPTVLKETVMKEHGYELQYELYALAVRRWLDSLGMTDVRLGGALYLFCRGVDCELESDDGILFDDLSRFETDKLEERLAAL
ncbi:MAG: UvrD-helicase domain-containing protein, partial [Victivallales bacterium]|nr:UvrD-helicase domain-containing protein [Victivallales bacterium]